MKLKKLVESKRKSSADHFPGITPKDLEKASAATANKAATAAQSIKNVDNNRQPVPSAKRLAEKLSIEE